MPDDLKARVDEVQVDWTVENGEAPHTSEVIRYLLRLGLAAHDGIEDAEFDVDREQRDAVVRQAMVDWRRAEERRD